MFNKVFHSLIHSWVNCSQSPGSHFNLLIDKAYSIIVKSSRVTGLLIYYGMHVTSLLYPNATLCKYYYAIIWLSTGLKLSIAYIESSTVAQKILENRDHSFGRNLFHWNNKLLRVFKCLVNGNHFVFLITKTCFTLFPEMCRTEGYQTRKKHMSHIRHFSMWYRWLWEDNFSHLSAAILIFSHPNS